MAEPTACDLRALVFDYINTLVYGLQIADYKTTFEQLVAREAATTTTLAVGLSLLIVPALLGPTWLLKLLWLAAALAGAAASVIFLETSGAWAVGSLAGLFGLGDSGSCILALLIVFLVALVLGCTVHHVAELALFAAGGLAAGYAASIAFGLGAPLVSSQFDISMEKEYLYSEYLFVGVFGLAGGCLLPKMANALLQILLPLFGALLIGQAALELVLVNDLLDASVIDSIGLRRYLVWYQAGVALVCYVLARRALVAAKPPAPGTPASAHDEGLIMR